MPANTRTKAQREKDLETTAALYLQGWTQLRIAERLNLTRQQIGYDLKAIFTRWRESSVRDFDEKRAEELAKVNHVEQTYWDSWEQSRKPNKAGLPTEPGDPRFLSGVERCIERRCKLLGLDAPEKFEVHDKTLAVIPPVDWEDADDND